VAGRTSNGWADQLPSSLGADQNEADWERSDCQGRWPHRRIKTPPDWTRQSPAGWL